MAYPLIVLLLAGSLTVGFFPGFAGVLTSLPRLPALTRSLMAISEVVRRPEAWLIAFLAVAGVLFAVGRALRQPQTQVAFWRAACGLPALGKALRDFTASRFASALALLMGTGVDTGRLRRLL